VESAAAVGAQFIWAAGCRGTLILKGDPYYGGAFACRTGVQRAASVTDLRPFALTVLVPLFTALILLAAGIGIARWAERSISRFLEHHRVLDPTFRGVVNALVRYAIILVAVIAALQQIGIQTTSILAALGAVVVAVGLALQGTLSNIAAGIMLLWLRPFRVGDAIETSSVAGTVADVGLFATEVHRADGVYVFVPNSDLWSRPVANLSRMPARMIELKFTIKKATNITSAREGLISAAAAVEGVRKEPAPQVKVISVTEAGVVLSLTAWAEAGVYAQALSQLAERSAAGVAEL
jgi:small conductance mechanosensitive channel